MLLHEMRRISFIVHKSTVLGCARDANVMMMYAVERMRGFMCECGGVSRLIEHDLIRLYLCVCLVLGILMSYHCASGDRRVYRASCVEKQTIQNTHQHQRMCDDVFFFEARMRPNGRRS